MGTSISCQVWVDTDDVEEINATVAAFGRTLHGMALSVTAHGLRAVCYLDGPTVTLNSSTTTDTAATGYVAMTVQEVQYLVRAATDIPSASGSSPTGTASSAASSAASPQQRAGPAAISMLLTLMAAFTSGFILISS